MLARSIVCPGTRGAELLDELKPEPSVALDADLLVAAKPQEVGAHEWVTYKPRWGAFYRTALEGHLRAPGLGGRHAVAGVDAPAIPPFSLKAEPGALAA
jgi:nicotinamidase-related amidase